MTFTPTDPDVSAALQGMPPVDAARWLADHAPSEASAEQARDVLRALARLAVQGVPLALRIVQAYDDVPPELLAHRGMACRLSNKPEAMTYAALVNGPSVTGKEGTTWGVLLAVLADLVQVAEGTVQFVCRDELRVGEPGANVLEQLAHDPDLWPGLRCTAVQCPSGERVATSDAEGRELSDEPGTSGSITHEYIDENGKPACITFFHVSERMFYENQKWLSRQSHPQGEDGGEKN